MGILSNESDWREHPTLRNLPRDILTDQDRAEPIDPQVWFHPDQCKRGPHKDTRVLCHQNGVHTVTHADLLKWLQQGWTYRKLRARCATLQPTTREIHHLEYYVMWNPSWISTRLLRLI